MSDRFEQLMRAAKKARLSLQEKSTMRGLLAAFVASHPRRSRAWFFLSALSLKRVAVSFAAIVFALAGGTSYAADGALPKDLLYSVKVNVNERVRAAVAFSPRAKAEVASSLVERRLEEAEELASSGELDSKTQAEIEARLEAHAGEAGAQIAKLKKSNKESDNDTAAEISLELESALDSHAHVLIKLSERRDATVLKELAAKVRAQERAAERERKEVEQEVKLKKVKAKAAAKKLKAAQNKIETVRKNDGSLNDEARAKIDDAENLVAQSKTKIEEGAYEEAFDLLQHVGRATTEARIAGKARARLKIDIDLDLDEEASTATTTDS